MLEARLRDRDVQKTERSKRFVSLGRTLADNEDESPIIAMLLDDYYQQMLHAPLPQPVEAPSDKGKGQKSRKRAESAAARGTKKTMVEEERGVVRGDRKRWCTR